MKQAPPRVQRRIGRRTITKKRLQEATVPAAELARVIIGDDEREHFIALYLDARNRIKGVSVVSIGTMTASLVHPREVFRAAVAAGAAAVIIVHNHPSGRATPSRQDRGVTRRLIEAGRTLGVEIADHVIVTKDAHFSFREGGIL